MNYLITGGTGTIGNEIVRQLLPTLSDTGKIVIFSRDEAKQAAMKEVFPEGGALGMRYMVGDICDYDRLKYAMRGIDVCIHAAAMKRIETCEYNPLESIRVNVEGSVAVARACESSGVERAIFLSTDKACMPISGYGAQKATVEHMWIGMNNLGKTRFNVIRYGNVWGSRGSFLKKWDDIARKGETIQLTHADMTRFFWRIDEAARFILKIEKSLRISWNRGCIFIPKMHAVKMLHIAKGFTDKIEITGMRCPEKIHEDLISIHESISCYDQGDHYVIYPMQHDWAKKIEHKGQAVEDGFVLSSGNTDQPV